MKKSTEEDRQKRLMRTWITTNEAMEYMACGRDMLEKLREDGAVRCSKIGKMLYWSIVDIENLFKRNVMNAQLHRLYALENRIP